MASLDRRVAKLEAMRAPEPPGADPALAEEFIENLRLAAARHGAERMVQEFASGFAAELGRPLEEMEAMLRDAISDVRHEGEQSVGDCG